MTHTWSMAERGTNTQASGTRPWIDGHPQCDGVRIVDPIERTQLALLTPSSVEPTACTTEEFYFPVDTAARICTTELESRYPVDIWVRDSDGDLITESTKEESVSVPPGQYNLQVSPVEMKLYLAVDGGVHIDPHDDRVSLSFTETQSVTIGVRSVHKQPAATITTTDDPADLMEAISAFGSALKTTSCERSFPTLRGHPPLLERGDELDVPEAISVPETGVRIQVPPTYEYIYPIASLAYYLGATVEPGDQPRLYADGEWFSLTADGDFESTVARILKHVFVMDCITRTEGYYPVELHQRNVVESATSLDFAVLYEKPLAEQVRTYLSVPWATIVPTVPQWKVAADVIADAGHAETLPFLTKDLAVIRCPNRADIDSRAVYDESTTITDFFGSAPETSSEGSTRSGQSSRSSTDSGQQPFEERVFRPPSAESIEQTYVGDGIPIGATKMSLEAFRRRLNDQKRDDLRPEVIVVCNEEEMAGENNVSSIYGTREWIEFDITIKENLTTSQLEDVLARNADLFHYIGHVDEEGIRCADGWLDCHQLADVGTSAFLLNACKSYEQGQALVENGAIGGIVTIADLLNETATKLGRTLARLLNEGFSMSASLELLERNSIIGNHYLVVGDGNTQIVKSQSGAPVMAKAETTETGISMQLYFYPCRNYGLGSFTVPRVGEEDTKYLTGDTTEKFHLDRERVKGLFEKYELPVELDNKIYWSEEYPFD